MIDAELLVGATFGRWQVFSEAKRRTLPCGQQHRVFICECECGMWKPVLLSALLSGASKSCGCLRNELQRQRVTHGSSRLGDISDEYKTWGSMIQRCENPKCQAFEDYGGRGISICPRWRNSFENFLKDMGPRPQGMSIERKDGDGNYEPGNCIWATKLAQTQNRRNTKWVVINGEKLTLAEAAKIGGVDYDLALKRVTAGWSHEDAVSAPSREIQSQKITIRGESKTIREWSAISGVPHVKIRIRIRKLGWSEEDAIFTPIRKLTRRKSC